MRGLIHAAHRNVTPTDNALQKRCVSAAENDGSKGSCLLAPFRANPPVLEKADCISENPEADEYRLSGLIPTLYLDPGSEHVSVLAALIRGFEFDFVMNRSEDLKRGNTRQLPGFQSQPGNLLAETAAAVHGRTTSWEEDEEYAWVAL